jgi:RNA polymerase sigma-70 factor, ECF subfamily
MNPLNLFWQGMVLPNLSHPLGSGALLMSSNLLNYSIEQNHSFESGQTDSQSFVRDSDLWLRLKLGDERAIADLYDLYSQLVYNVAYGVLRDWATSEDVLQEVFLQLWRVPGAFEPSKGTLGAWLTVVSRRRAIDLLRQRKEHVDIADVVVPVHATQCAEASLNQIARKLGSILKQLPERATVIFELAYVQGLTHTEISERLGIPLGTAKTRIRQVVGFIRARLDQAGI